MREIKFRAWHESLMLMGNVITMHFGENISEMCEVDLGDVDGRYLTDPVSDFVFMQYTGLKDKNGIEVYEGDILDSVYIYDKAGMAIVIFERGCFGVIHTDKDKFNGDLYSKHRHASVIGNIYENPELINT